MLLILFICLLFLMLASILLIIPFFIANKSFLDREKISPFECGFDPKNSSRLPFSSHFFMIAIIFLIFDVEITILLPIPITIYTSNNMLIYMTSMVFVITLLLGLFYEWLKGSLKWMS